MFFSILCFLLGLLLILLYSFHYTIILLSLEILLLGLFLFFCFDCYGMLSFLGTFAFILIMVCMGGFSISLLVSLTRGYGRDYWFSGAIF